MRKEDDKRLEMWVWRAMEKVRWVDKVRNDEVLRRIDVYKRQVENKTTTFRGKSSRI